jgi:hypothetical protein
MLYSLFECGKTFAIGFLLNDYFKRNYQAEYNNFCIDAVFNVIYVYSYCEMIYNNIIKYMPSISYFSDDIFKFTIEKISTIHFIKNNSVVLVKSFLNEIDFKIPEYDFIVYTDGRTKQNNMKIIRNIDIVNNNDNLNKNLEYEKSNIKFMMIEVNLNDIVYSIELSNKNYNFYIKDNIFDKQFFLYYLRYFHPDKVNIDETSLIDEITLKIIDNNADVKRIYFTNKNQYIKLNETDYTIIDE